MTNLLRHSDAQHVRLDLARTGPNLTLTISNDGVRPPTAPPGLGLAGLAERAAQAGARLRTGVVGDRFEVRLELMPG